jgi:dCTP deaminase
LGHWAEQHFESALYASLFLSIDLQLQEVIMVLTHLEIAKLIADGAVMRPKAKPVLDAVSVTLHLGEQFAHYQPSTAEPFVPPMEMPLVHTRSELSAEGYVLHPGSAVLASSEEVIAMPLDLMGLMQTKSSLARGFLMIHPSAGHVEPGFKGVVTFEIVNLSNFHYRLLPGMPIGKLFFFRLVSEVAPEHGYSGRYQGSMGPIGMK